MYYKFIAYYQVIQGSLENVLSGRDYPDNYNR